MQIVLYGASGHAKVVLEIVLLQGEHTVIGFLDDDSGKTGSKFESYQVLGPGSMAPSLREQGVAGVIVAIGDNQVRLEKAAWLTGLGFALVTAVHPRAFVSSRASLGAGTVVMAGAVVNPGTVIGANAIINTSATVDHDCVLEDGVHISPGAHLAGGVRVGRGAHIGIGASVIGGLTIGEFATVGAGAVVVWPVPDGVVVVGVPAHVLRKEQG